MLPLLAVSGSATYITYIFVICSCSVCALSPHKNRSLLTGGRLVKASAHICGLCALVKKLFILFLFRATVAVAFKKIKDSVINHNGRKLSKWRKRNCSVGIDTHSPAESKFCFSSFLIRGRPGFILSGEVGVFCAAGWMK